MGNSLHDGVSLLRNGNCSNRVQLGTHATIDITGEKSEKDGEHIKDWTVKYTIDGSSCVLSCTRRLSQGGNVNKASFKLDDDACEISIFVDFEMDPFRISTYERYQGSVCGLIIPYLNNIIRSKTFFYGSGNKGGLLVLDSKEVSVLDKKVYVVTVAHYYAAIIGNIFGKNRIDIGLSVIAKARVSNNRVLDFTVEGPLQHPATALFYMFDEVKRTRIWKPTACPHCANIQRQRNGMFGQSDSEDSDGLPPPRLHGPRQNGGSVLANDGVVRGNYNGNFNVRNPLVRGR